MNESSVSAEDHEQGFVQHPPGIVAWLEEFASKVRSVDYDGGRKLFSVEVFGFGTKADAYHSLDEWHFKQWRHVWPKTTGFQFNLTTLRTVLSSDGSLCCTSCEWESKGIRADGGHFPRQGRSTILLSRSPERDFGWIGVHSHFSMPPQAS
jgi:hypothetical protein